jgi:hypothetical protein
MHPECPDLVRFVRGEIAAADFPHREHVRMAFEMLRRHDFAETVWLYSWALRAMAARAGKPQAFNQTVTIAFLSLIAERMEQGRAVDFAVFARDNPAVFHKDVLARWYPREQLTEEITRRVFVLPAPADQRPHVTPAGRGCGADFAVPGLPPEPREPPATAS